MTTIEGQMTTAAFFYNRHKRRGALGLIAPVAVHLSHLSGGAAERPRTTDREEVESA